MDLEVVLVKNDLGGRVVCEDVRIHFFQQDIVYYKDDMVLLVSRLRVMLPLLP